MNTWEKTRASLTLILIIVMAFGAICGCLYGCEKMVFEERHEKGNIVSVYMHEPGRYSVMVERGNKLVPKYFYNAKTEIIRDIPAGSNMWYESYYRATMNHTGYRWVKIHIRSVDDINTAGWNHEKFGSGMTHEISK